MSFFRHFLNIFVSPSQVFDAIRDSRVSWWQPWLMVSVISLLQTWLAAPIQEAAMELNPALADQGAQGQVAMMRTFGMVMTPAIVLIVNLMVAAVSYVMVTLMSREATFKKYFALLLFANIVFALGSVITAALLHLRGIENITTIDDMHMSLSLRFLAPEDSTFLKGLLGSLEFFVLWGLALVAMGLQRIFGLRRGQALACVVPLWVLFAVITIVSEWLMRLER